MKIENFKILDEIGQSSIDLFGQETNPLPSLKHLLKEVQETIDAPNDEMEYADMLILLFGAFKRTGRTAQNLIEAALKKVEINKTRTWGKPDEDGVIAHISSIPITIWDDFYDDGYVPEGKKQKTYIYVENSDISHEDVKKYLEVLLKYMVDELMLGREGINMWLEYYDSKLKYPQLVGTENECLLFERWKIQIENLTHERLFALLRELQRSKLSVDGIPFDFYSES